MTRYFARFGLWVWIVSCLAALPARGQDSSVPQPFPIDRPSHLTFEELRTGIREYYNRITAIDVEYQLDQKTINEIQGDTEQPLIPSARHRFAMRGEGRYIEAESVIPGAKQSDKFTAAYEGTNFRMYRPDHRQGQIWKEKHAIADTDFYAGALFMRLSDTDRTQSRSPYFLPLALDYTDEKDKAGGSYWTVRPKLESVDGFPCHVLESKDLDRIWIDPAVGFGVRFREIREPVEAISPSDRPFMNRWHLNNFKEVAGKIWLPNQVDVVFFTGSSAPRSMWNRVSRVQRMKVLRIEVNAGVSDKLFFLQFPPGTTVTDYVQRKYYDIRKGGELADVIDMAEEELGPGSRRARYISAIVIVNLVIFVIIIGFIVARRMRTQTKMAK